MKEKSCWILVVACSVILAAEAPLVIPSLAADLEGPYPAWESAEASEWRAMSVPEVLLPSEERYLRAAAPVQAPVPMPDAEAPGDFGPDYGPDYSSDHSPEGLDQELEALPQ